MLACAGVRDVRARLGLTLTAALSSGGGCVSKYSVACSIVLVFRRASIACSLEKPMSISCVESKGNKCTINYVVVSTTVSLVKSLVMTCIKGSSGT